MEETNLKEKETEENINNTDGENREIKVKKNNKKKKIIISVVIISIILVAILAFSTVFAIININNDKIVSGVKIKGIDVSGLTEDEAKNKIELIYQEKNSRDIELKYEDYEASINSELLEINYEIENAVKEAISVGKSNNIFANNYNILFALIGKKDINVNMSINEEIAKQKIEDIGTNLPGALEEPDYYIEGSNLIITKGKEGIKVDTENLLQKIKDKLDNINEMNDIIEIPVINEKPQDIDIQKIHDEIYKEVQDAYYTKEPFTIHPEVEGIDFNVEDAKNMLETILGYFDRSPEIPNGLAYLNSAIGYMLYGWVHEWMNRGMQESGTEIARMFAEAQKKQA